MTLEQQFKSVTEKNLGRIAELNDKVSANLKQANYYANVLRRSQQSLSTAKSKVFKDKVKLAEKYIKDVIGKTKVPTTWNAKRVKELRRVLASGSERTVADRCKKLAALRELQLYIDTFPLVDRVADLVRKWTGCSDVEVCSPGNYDQTLKIKGHTVLEVHSYAGVSYRFPPGTNLGEFANTLLTDISFHNLQRTKDGNPYFLENGRTLYGIRQRI